MANQPAWLAAVILVVGLGALGWSSTWLVDGAVGIAERVKVPKLLIGIVLVGFATTAPEFAVSILSALQDSPEMALGNAVGSVIVDDGVALAMVGLFAAAPVLVPRRMLLQTAVFLMVIDVAAFLLVITNKVTTPDGETFVLWRWGGAVLLGLFFVYLAYIIWDSVKRPAKAGEEGDEGEKREEGKEPKAGVEAGGTETGAAASPKSLAVLIGIFLVGLVVVIGSSEVVVLSAIRIADWAGVPKAVVALTIVAIGTSLPEIATCITATRKGHGALAVGDILGADVLNIAWIAGASALVHPLQVRTDVIYFMFPSMLVIVFTMLAGLIIRRKMTRGLGIVLLAEYAVYMALMAYLFLPQLG